MKVRDAVASLRVLARPGLVGEHFEPRWRRDSAVFTWTEWCRHSAATQRSADEQRHRDSRWDVVSVEVDRVMIIIFESATVTDEARRVSSEADHVNDRVGIQPSSSRWRRYHDDQSCGSDWERERLMSPPIRAMILHQELFIRDIHVCVRFCVRWPLRFKLVITFYIRTVFIPVALNNNNIVLLTLTAIKSWIETLKQCTYMKHKWTPIMLIIVQSIHYKWLAESFSWTVGVA